MNPACDAEDYSPSYSSIDEPTDRFDFYRKFIDDLVVISRYIKLINSDGHPFTHVNGVSIDDIKAKIDCYAIGKNLGSSLPVDTSFKEL